jgi:hypothetical protein
MNYPPSQFPAAGPGVGYPGMQPGARAKVQPGRLWYLAALVLLLGGVGWLVFGLVSLNSQINSFPRVRVPTTGSPVSLTHAGSYVIYYEADGAASNPLPGFDVRIAPDSAGADVTSIAPYGSSVTYSFGSRQGRAALTLQIASPGRFLVIAPLAPSVAGGSDLAFGTGIVSGIVGIAVPAALAMLVGISGLIVIFVIRYQRTRQQRAAMAGGAGYPGGPGGQPYPGGPGGQGYQGGPGYQYPPAPGYQYPPGQPYPPGPGHPCDPGHPADPGQPYPPSPGQPYPGSPGQEYPGGPGSG